IRAPFAGTATPLYEAGIKRPPRSFKGTTDYKGSVRINEPRRALPSTIDISQSRLLIGSVGTSTIGSNFIPLPFPGGMRPKLKIWRYTNAAQYQVVRLGSGYSGSTRFHVCSTGCDSARAAYQHRPQVIMLTGL